MSLDGTNKDPYRFSHINLHIVPNYHSKTSLTISIKFTKILWSEHEVLVLGCGFQQGTYIDLATPIYMK
jgi:hypothetical protein